MDNQRPYKTPKGTLAGMQVVHFGKILFNMQFVALAIMIASLISFVLPLIYYVLLASVTMLTLFLLLLNPTFRALWAGGEVLTKIAEVMLESWKYTVPAVAILSIASIVCLCFDKQKNQTARIVVSAIFAVLSGIVLILKLSGAVK